MGRRLVTMFLVVVLAMALPLWAQAANRGVTSSAAEPAATAGWDVEDVRGAARPDAALELPPGVVSPLSRLLPDDGGCYEPFWQQGGKGKRCEPQCIPYVRCRSGIMSCRIGRENGPLTWFACEERRGNTAVVPEPGSVLILAANTRRKMPTGHGLYVEEVIETAPSLYKLILSHTNYDRRCSIETNIEAEFDRRQMTVDFLSGAWRAWGRDLAVAGFIRGGADEALP
jgi:hypothetical protein